ncbi:hypothetical protein E2562_006775 [Oryza meyeriana var. granulata]|uniref:NAC domain-containing protein n=1 Tax=Oryza meyeriana var. granulata TaxID=110450 RepID=A0A6G1C4F3_9ORYZ|nr:hypothetical protein E2562_006775 [Oryza meyeriana var. granulata]
MAGDGLCIPLVHGSTMRLPAGCVFRPTEGELVFHYLYRPLAERENGKYLFTRKEIKYPGSRRSNRVTGNGFWRSAGSEKPVYYHPGGGSDRVLVGMRHTLTFHYGSSRTAERTKWGMKEFRLAGFGLLPCPVMRRATVDSSKPPFTSRNDGVSAVVRYVLAPAHLVKTVVEPDGSWLICCIYKKRQCAPHVIVPPAIGNAGEIIINPANVHARVVDFLRQAPHLDPSSPCSCIMGPTLEEGSDESAGGSDEKDQKGNGTL